MTSDSDGDWPERQARRPGRHSRAPEEYGEPDYALPPELQAPQPRRYVPDSQAQPGPGAAPRGRAAAPDPLTDPRRYAGPDPLADPRRYAGPDPLADPRRYAGPDPLADPRRYAGPDPLADPRRRTPPDSYPPPGRPGRPDPLTAPGPYPPPAPAERAASPDAVTDPSARRPDLPPRRQPYEGRPARGGRGDYDDPLAAPRGQNADGRPRSPDPLTGGRQQNGYGPAGSYHTPSRPSGGYGADDDAADDYAPGAYAGDYGPADDEPAGYSPPGRGGPRGYARPGEHGDGDDPFRWHPPHREREPEELAPLPGYGGGTDGGPRPRAGEWDVSQEHDWDLSLDDSAIGAAPPVAAPPGHGRWENPADDTGEPDDWDDEPPRRGLVPGLDDTGGSRGGGRRGARRRIGRMLAPLVALVLLVGLGLAGYKIYRHFRSPDYTGPGTGEVTVHVPTGASAFSLAPELVQLGVVASTSSFVSAAKDSSNPEGLEPGYFRLHHHMNSALAYKLLLNPASRIQSVVTVPEGLRESQILQKLEATTKTPASKFTAALKDPAALGLPSFANGNPEGYLFPATYNFGPGTSAAAMLKAMVARFNQEASSINLPAAAKTAQLTPAQVITVASILEAEAGSPKYYKEVAEVIYNRLNQGMFLGLDSTVNYALHRFGVSLTNAQLHVNSPYNTFIHKGLPPGPIDSPGDAAIQAALHPAHGDLLYFVTVNLKTGLTKFTSSPTQFQQFENECNQNKAC